MWLVKVAKFSYLDLTSKLHINLLTIKANVKAFFSLMVIAPYLKSCQTPAKMLLCKEDKEQVTKAKIGCLISLFAFCEALND
jgi:hypothetical protein